MAEADKVGRFRYNDEYMSMYAPYHDVVSKIDSKANVLIFGANDGIVADPTYYVWKDTWRGYFVEPNPYAMERLKQNRVGTFIPYAVNGSDDVLTLYAMTEKVAKEYEKVGANGSCLTTFNRRNIEIRLLNNLATTTEQLGLENMISQFTVSCKTVKNIIREYEIGKVDLVQIDIEGLEPEVVPQCLKLGIDVVLWEHQHLYENQKSNLCDLAHSLGYEVTELPYDTFAYKNV